MRSSFRCLITLTPNRFCPQVLRRTLNSNDSAKASSWLVIHRALSIALVAATSTRAAPLHRKYARSRNHPYTRSHRGTSLHVTLQLLFQCRVLGRPLTLRSRARKLAPHRVVPSI